MTWTDPLTDADLSLALFISVKAVWLAWNVLILLGIELVIRTQRSMLTPVLLESLRWARLAVLGLMGFNGIGVIHYLISRDLLIVQSEVVGDLEWGASFAAVTMYASYRFVTPWVGIKYLWSWKASCVVTAVATLLFAVFAVERYAL